MLRSLFAWFDQHPSFYGCVAGAVTLLLLGWIWQTVKAERARLPLPAWAGGRDALLLFLFVGAWRWPFLLISRELNPDESQLIAGAITLTRDPVFWRSVDGTTSGPLNFYVLLPWHWLGLPLDYFTARLTGLLLVWGALLAVLRTLSRVCGASAAWLSVLPAAALIATTTSPDLIHYSSEHVSVLLTALAVLLLIRWQSPHQGRLWAACVLIGALPWAKLQAAPLALVLAAWTGWRIWKADGPSPQRRFSLLARAIGLTLAPTALVIIFATATGQADDVWQRFVLSNFVYASHPASIAAALRAMAELAMVDGRLPLFLATAVLVLLAGGIVLLVRRVRISSFYFFGGLLSVAAVVAVITPRWGFLHYTLLLPVPLTLWAGSSLGEMWKQMTRPAACRSVAVIMLGLGGVLPAVTRLRQPPQPILESFSYNWRHPRGPLAMVVDAVAGRQGALAIWGWACDLYVECGLPQATRDAHCFWLIVDNPQRDYYRATYLKDFAASHPEVFVDVTGPEALGFRDRPTQGHETFPQLARHIANDYTLVSDTTHGRIYVRNDLAHRTPLTTARINELMDRARAPGR